MSFIYNPNEYPESKVKVVAEIGCNHKGSMDIAKEMIKISKIFCGADYAKFQKRTNRELLTDEEYNAPHPNPVNAYGKTYGEHREFLEFTKDQHAELKEFCNFIGIGYTTSVWDLTAAKEIVELSPDFIKIPSACNLDTALLEFLIRAYSGDIHVSFGMTTKEEELNIVDIFRGEGALKRLVIYSCTSGYPVPFEDLSLKEIVRLKESFGAEVGEIGFSGHHNGIAADIAAMTLGATWVERHFTLNRTWKGTDHAASLEPDGFRKLVRDLHNVELALAYKKMDILEIESVQRNKLKRIAGKHF